MILAVVGLLLVAVGSAQATLVTFQFDPNDLLNLSPASAGSDMDGGRKIDQDNSRRLRKLSSYSPDGTTVDTFWDPAGHNTQPKEYNTYRNWLDGLGSDEGIASFNIWMANSGPVRSWGETLVTKPNSAVTGTAASGWSVEIIANPWVTGSSIARWYADDSSKYLRPGGTDIGDFSFTVDAYADSNENGWDASDPGAVVGENYRIWFGSQNGQESDRGNGAIFFDADGWGNRTESFGAFAAVNNPPYVGSGWEGVLELTAIPEPASIIVWGLLGAGCAGGVMARRRRRRAPWSEETRQNIHQIIDQGRTNA
jgi:hypothetical protein